jgi:hypothetical protein
VYTDAACHRTDNPATLGQIRTFQVVAAGSDLSYNTRPPSN